MPEPTLPHPPAPSTVPAPALTSTADAVPYVPVSWLAVGAGSVALLFLLLLVVLGIIAYKNHRPLLEEELLVLAGAAVVLGFAARRVIRNSEGTRTGELFGIDLPNAAWWTGLVVGLGYATYIFAIQYSIQRDARGEVERWTELILKSDPESLSRAFHRTRVPIERANISPTDRAQLSGRWGNEMTGFEQCDLVRVIQRNPERSTIILGGLRDWAYRPTGVECTFTATIKCPEGSLPIAIPLRAFDTAASGESLGGRQWQVLYFQNGYFQPDQTVRITRYGWFVNHLEATGRDAGRQFLAVNATGLGRERRTAAVLDLIRPGDPMLRPLQAGGVMGQAGRVASAVGSASPIAMGTYASTLRLAWTPGIDFLDHTADRLFTMPGGTPPTDENRKRFRTIWANLGIVRPGERLRETTDVNETVNVTPTSVEFRLPVELPLSDSQREISAARGRAVFVCTEPDVIAMANRLRDNSDSDTGVEKMPDEIAGLRVNWKLVRVESDLKAVVVRPQAVAPPGTGGQ